MLSNICLQGWPVPSMTASLFSHVDPLPLTIHLSVSSNSLPMMPHGMNQHLLQQLSMEEDQLAKAAVLATMQLQLTYLMPPKTYCQVPVLKSWPEWFQTPHSWQMGSSCINSCLYLIQKMVLIFPSQILSTFLPSRMTLLLMISSCNRSKNLLNNLPLNSCCHCKWLHCDPIAASSIMKYLKYMKWNTT